MSQSQMWPVSLSVRYPSFALVSHYLTNKLIGRESIHQTNISFHTRPCGSVHISIRRRYPTLFTESGEVTHVLLTVRH